MDHWLPQPLGADPYRHWLCQPGSLTRALQRRCDAFRVSRVRQTLSKAYPGESPPLDLVGHEPLMVRDVVLSCGDLAVVYAHTLLPTAGLNGPWHHLGTLGNRPLGAALFADPKVQRGPLAYRRLSRRDALYRAAIQDLGSRGITPLPARLWARRCVFSLEGHPLLVTEVFLPPILTLGRP